MLMLAFANSIRRHRWHLPSSTGRRSKGLLLTAVPVLCAAAVFLVVFDCALAPIMVARHYADSLFGEKGGEDPGCRISDIDPVAYGITSEVVRLAVAQVPSRSDPEHAQGWLIWRFSHPAPGSRPIVTSDVEVGQSDKSYRARATDPRPVSWGEFVAMFDSSPNGDAHGRKQSADPLERVRAMDPNADYRGAAVAASAVLVRLAAQGALSGGDEDPLVRRAVDEVLAQCGARRAG